MTKAKRRRTLALLLPLPVIAGAGLVLWSLSLWKWLTMLAAIPYAFAFVIWISVDRALGKGVLGDIGLHVIGASAAVGFWYLMLAAIFQAVLCPRDKVSRAIFTAAILAGLLACCVGWSLVGFNPD